METNPSATSLHYRKIDSLGVVLPIVSLIEASFAATMDDEGREYLEDVRKYTQNALINGGFPGEKLRVPMRGFYCEVEGKVVGNVTIIPFGLRGPRHYLIANVSVDPAWRGQGIGHRLTEIAANQVKQYGCKEVWLQVRAENQPANHIYKTLGFKTVLKRTTWVKRNFDETFSVYPSEMKTETLRQEDWPEIEAGLNRCYPSEANWYLGLDKQMLKPGFLNGFRRLLNGRKITSLTSKKGNVLQGAAFYEDAQMRRDTVWLSLAEASDKYTLAELIAGLAEREKPRKGFVVNYPFGVSTEAFDLAGFEKQMDLNWMRLTF